MNKIAIVGCGWLGLEVGEKLLKRGCSILGSTTCESKFSILTEAGIQPFKFQLGDELSSIREMLSADIFILNIPPGRRRSDVLAYYPKFLIALINQLSRHTNLIFTSSTSVYGNAKGKVTETMDVQPVSDAAKAIVQVEAHIASTRKRQSTILRLAGLIGGERRPGRFLAGRTDLPNGDAPINLVHREDCLGVIEAVIAQNSWGQVFNVCADKHPAKNRYYSEMAKRMQLALPTFLEGGAKGKIIDNNHVKEFLHYQFTFPDPYQF